MPKRWFKRVLPKSHYFKEHKHLKQIFGEMLHSPNLWHLNRQSVSNAFAIGLFFAFMPMPFQMVAAAGCAILFHANLPLSSVMVWVTNPLTMPPMFFFCYKVGSYILGIPPTKIHFSLTTEWFSHKLLEIWEPFLLGCFIVASASAIIGYISIRILWRIVVTRDWHLRKKRRLKKH